MAGFYVVGCDIESQPHYIGDDFLQADALEILRILIGGGCIIGKGGRVYHLEDFSLIAASPPCQLFTPLWNIAKKPHANLIPATRELLKQVGKPYVIENVPGSPLEGNLMLCGTMFNLRTIRHRVFETWPMIWIPPTTCNHDGKRGNHSLRDETGKRVIQSFERVDFISVAGNSYKASDGRIALGIDWMIQDELDQAIPPKYTEYIGKQMLESIRAEA